jgi:electron-transferring-flavoprotein dehydrogenase
MSEQTGINLNIEGVEREELEVDVLIVGAGPAAMACAIQLKRALVEKGKGDTAVLVLEKAEEVGYHLLSGAVMDPRAIAELYPDWLEKGFPVESKVEFDCVDYLKKNGGKMRIGGPFVPPNLRNHGNYIISLYRITEWLKEQAEALEIDVYPGFAGAGVLYDGDRVVGVQTRDAGIDKHGEKKPQFEPGMDVKAKVTVFAEGTRGSLAKGLIAKLGLDKGCNHHSYETGAKELWSVPEERGAALRGHVIHTMGVPLGTEGYGGGFVYGLSENRIALGFVVGLDHPDPALDPHAMFAAWKQHPAIRELIEGGELLRYGAKTMPGGGYFAMPRRQGDGFVLVGDSAGFLNMARLKGVHLAIKSGMLAADAIVEALDKDDTSEAGLSGYTRAFESSWAKDELWSVRNFRQAFQSGFFAGAFDVAIQMISGGRGLSARRPMTEDHVTTRSLAKSKMVKPTFDDKYCVDKLTDVFLSGAIHEEDQPSHLVIGDPSICIDRCTAEYGNPCQHFCPAGVYEWPHESTEEAKAAGGVMVSASNCVHCKTCDVADPYQNIEWTVPEGGGGPKFVDM